MGISLAGNGTPRRDGRPCPRLQRFPRRRGRQGAPGAGDRGRAVRIRSGPGGASETAPTRMRKTVRATVALLGDALNRLSEGDLTVRLQEPFIEELDTLRVDFNKSVIENAQRHAKRDQGKHLRHSWRCSRDALGPRTTCRAAPEHQAALAGANLRRARTTDGDCSQFVRTRSGSKADGRRGPRARATSQAKWWPTPSTRWDASRPLPTKSQRSSM